MALALDEPDAEDLRQELDGVPIVMDQIASEIIQNAGVLKIYLTTFGPKAKLESDCSG